MRLITPLCNPVKKAANVIDRQQKTVLSRHPVVDADKHVKTKPSACTTSFRNTASMLPYTVVFVKKDNFIMIPSTKRAPLWTAGLCNFCQILIDSTERRSMSCVALDGRALATYSCYMQSMLFYCKFSRKCDATERLMLFSGEPILHRFAKRGRLVMCACPLSPVHGA